MQLTFQSRNHYFFADVTPLTSWLRESASHGSVFMIDGLFMLKYFVSCICVTPLLWGMSALAHQSAPSTNPTGTTQRTRYELTLPPGFQRVAVGHRTAICEAGDKEWVARALSVAAPATQPSTTPVDLVQKLKDQRQLLKARIAGDLALADVALIDQLIDDVLIPRAQSYVELDAPIFYLVATNDRLKQLLKEGWNDPRFKYDAAIDDVLIDPGLHFRDEGPMDDMLMPVIYAPNATPENRAERLTNVVRVSEAGISDSFSRRALVITQLALIDFIQKQGIEPLHLKKDQQWFGLGAAAVLSTRYMHDIVGISADDLLSRIMRDDPRNPIRAGSIDLLNPMNESAIREEWLPRYADAYRIKSARVVRDWVQRSGESSIAMTLAAIRANPPADGAALLKVINMTTGVDLSTATKPN